MNVRAIAVKASENNNMTVGDWLAEAIVAHGRADRSGVSAVGGSNVPAIPLTGELKELLDGIQNRLSAIEAAKSKSLLSRMFGGHT
jgi:hypothetical protein